jgi:hypothetical protein
MKPDPKPTLSRAGILANIDHLECRVQKAHDNWQQELNELQRWLDQLDLLNKHTDGDSTVTTAKDSHPFFITSRGSEQ